MTKDSEQEERRKQIDVARWALIGKLLVDTGIPWRVDLLETDIKTTAGTFFLCSQPSTSDFAYEILIPVSLTGSRLHRVVEKLATEIEEAWREYLNPQTEGDYHGPR